MSCSTTTVTLNSAFPRNSNPKPRDSQNRRETISLIQKCKQFHQVPPIHAKIIRYFQVQDPFVVFELLRLCSNLNSIDYATKIFQQIQTPNVYLYTALIDGFVSTGFCLDAIRVYCRMDNESVSPDNYAVTSVLKACGFGLALEEGRGVHAQVLKLGLSSNRSVRMKLLDLYGKCGEFEYARRMFDEMPDKDVVASTVMITSFSDYGLIEEAIGVFNRARSKDTMNRALEVFREMQRNNVRPNEVTVVCVLSACSYLGALELGRWVHSYIDKYDIEFNYIVGGARGRDVSSYNSMIEGLAMHGKSIEAIQMFQTMIKQGPRPNSITFIFHSMTSIHGIQPQIEHYGCMIDLLGRSGQLEETYNFIARMKSACKIHGNLELGERVGEILVNCGNVDSGTYVLLSNAYASSGRWKETAQVRAEMKESGTPKEPGCSLIEVNNEIHEFLLGDLRHPKKEEIYKKLMELIHELKSEGYLPATEAELALSIHSERLAICFGLIATKQGTTLRIVNNLGVCSDCHSMIKLIAKITNRKIVVRDRNRFHHFESGVCSCAVYW
ncbi:unnamed protein product [Malus baccata var. baccata]